MTTKELQAFQKEFFAASKSIMRSSSTAREVICLFVLFFDFLLCCYYLLPKGRSRGDGQMSRIHCAYLMTSSMRERREDVELGARFRNEAIPRAQEVGTRISHVAERCS